MSILAVEGVSEFTSTTLESDYAPPALFVNASLITGQYDM